MHRIPYNPEVDRRGQPSDQNQVRTEPQNLETTPLVPTNQYFEKKSYELQPQPPPPPPSQQHYSPVAEANNQPVVVHDHKHQQEVYNANIGMGSPSSTSYSSLVSTLSNISLGETRTYSGQTSGQYNPIKSSAETNTFSTASYPMPTTIPFGNESYSTQNTSPYAPTYGYTQPDYNTNVMMSSGTTTIPSYGVQSFTTPLSLPGMPPLTVSATLPSDKFANSYSPQTYNVSNLVPNQSMAYQMNPNPTPPQL